MGDQHASTCADVDDMQNVGDHQEGLGPACYPAYSLCLRSPPHPSQTSDFTCTDCVVVVVVLLLDESQLLRAAEYWLADVGL